MNGYSATVLADSVNPVWQRVTTVQIRMPLSVWAEFLTHRTMSRNARSNRAIPVSVTMSEVYHNPFVPTVWGSNKKGMQAGAELQGWRRWLARQVWLKARYPALAAAWVMNWAGLHKQDANRVLSPWQWVDAVVTAGAMEWEAFFRLRCHPDADPKIQVIAEMIRDARKASTPIHLGWGDWHLPYYCGQSGARAWASVGACARVSYRCFDGSQSDEENERLGTSMVDQDPAHASPLEHVLRADGGYRSTGPIKGNWNSMRQIEGV